jgi:acetolactate synthase-1/2/3 large subunit
MNIQELSTLGQYRLPVKLFILNNQYMGMVRQWQEAFYGERYSCSNMEVGMPDIELLAQAYGIKGMVISQPEELSGAIAQMLAHNGPVIVNAKVTRDENCYPMVAPGKNNAQMLGLPHHAKPDIKAINCNNCGTKNLPSHNFCAECGVKL